MVVNAVKIVGLGGGTEVLSSYSFVRLFRTRPLLRRVHCACECGPVFLGNVEKPCLYHWAVDQELGGCCVADDTFSGLVEDMAADGYSKKASEILDVEIRCLGELFESDCAFNGNLRGDLMAVDVLETEEKQLLVQRSDNRKEKVTKTLGKEANLARATKQKPQWT